MAIIQQTETQILEAMRKANRPLTITEMAVESRLSVQTIRNYVPNLSAQGKIRVYRIKVGRSFAYELSEKLGVGHGMAISWGKDMRYLHDIMEEIGRMGVPHDRLMRPIVQAIFELYVLTSLAMDDDNPQPVRNSELKQIMYNLSEFKNELRKRMEIVDDLLILDDLWDVNKLPKVLLMDDMTLTHEKLVSMIDSGNAKSQSKQNQTESE